MALKTVAFLFGGRSTEHEISVITALQAMEALDPYKYRAIPVYIGIDGKWRTGKELLNKAFYKKLPENFVLLQEVTILPNPTIKGLVPIQNGIANINEAIAIDICFLAFHGRLGEDGCIQGLLELAEIPYTGNPVPSSAVAMDKNLCKLLLNSLGIPSLSSITVLKSEAIANFQRVKSKVLNTPGLDSFPLFVKPCHLGSSIGISAVHNEKQLSRALAKVFQYDKEAIIEPYLTDLTEINISIIDADPPIASVVEIPITQGEALSYEDKYLRRESKNASQSQGMASLTRLINPEHLPDSIKQMVTQYAITAFSGLKCSGVVRFDFMLNNKTGNVYFNELNSIPGSLAFYLWEKTNPQFLYTEIIDRMLQRAIKRVQMNGSLQQSLPFKAL